MNGVIEETGKTTRSLIEALKYHPAMLVLCVANLALVGFLYFALSAAAQFRTELLRMNFETQKQAADLLARCAIPQ